MTSCIPAYPCCVPCDVAPAPLPQGAPLSYAANELAAMPQCCPKWQPPPKRTITVQQPPRLIVKKRTVCTTKLVHVPKIVSNVVQRDIPCITRCSKTVNIPVIRYFLEVYKEPKVTWFQSYVADPYVVNVPRIVIEPREICQTLLCQPKPQVVDVPKPTQYCMYPGGPEKLRCSLPCSPYPCPPTSGFPTCKSPACGPCSPCDPCGPCPPCGPCGPCPPYGPCGPCPPCGPCGPCPPCGPCGPCPPCGPCGPCGPPLGPCLPFDVCGSGSPCGGACGPCGLCP